MPKSRKRKFDKMSADVVAEKIPPKVNLPLDARPISEIEVIAADTIVLRNKIVGIAKETADTSATPTRHFFKRHESDTLAQLEAYASTICRFIATEEYVPTTRLYYDTETQRILGMTSQELPGFESLHDNPFRADDADIRSFNAEYHQNILMHLLTELLQFHQANIPTFFSARMLGLFRQPSAVVLFATQLHAYQNNPHKFMPSELEQFIILLNDRKEHLNQHANPIEIIALNKLLQEANTLLLVTTKRADRQLSIAEMDEIDADAKKNNINLAQRKYVFVTLDARRFRVQASDILHYRIVKGLTIALTTRYIMREGDNGANNNAKNGQMLDFEMSKMPLSFQFKPLDPIGIGRQLRVPDKKTVACTERDIRDFPVLKDAKFYFWPTESSLTSIKMIEQLMQNVSSLISESKENTDLLAEDNNTLSTHLTKLAKSLFIADDTNVISRKLMERSIKISIEEKVAPIKATLKHELELIKAHFVLAETEIRKLTGLNTNIYTPEDNQNFQLLRFHPVFKYFQYKTLLKFTLFPDDVFHAVAELQTSNEMLRTTLAKDDIDRRDQIAIVLNDMPEYKQFISTYGEQVFEQINREFSELKEMHAAKLAENPYYQRLVNAIDLDVISRKAAEDRENNFRGHPW